jgi:acyl-CoA hydrolase
MQLGNILNGARTQRAVTRPVKFRIIATNSREERTTAPAEAVLVFVAPDEHQEALVLAQEAIDTRFRARPIPAQVLASEQQYHFLLLALRDKSDPAKPFASSIGDLRLSIPGPVAEMLVAEYQRFVDEEFPDFVEDDDFEKLVEEAKKKPFADLLTSFGFSQIQRALGSLAARSGASLTRT